MLRAGMIAEECNQEPFSPRGSSEHLDEAFCNRTALWIRLYNQIDYNLICCIQTLVARGSYQATHELQTAPFTAYWSRCMGGRG